MISSVDVLGVPFAVTNYQEAAEFIIDRAHSHQPTAVYALPVHGVVEANTNAAFKQATDVADLIVPDGQPVRWFMNYVHKTKLKDRVYGPELVKHVLTAANQQKMKIYLYGGATETVLAQFVNWVVENYPKVVIAGQYREENFAQRTLDPNEIESSGAQLLLCALGCPAQELWIAESKAQFRGVMVGVGAAFSFHSGNLARAPKWMQDRGLEWLYRLTKEPKRLWKRYLYTNAYFIYLVMRHFARRIFSNSAR